MRDRDGGNFFLNFMTMCDIVSNYSTSV